MRKAEEEADAKEKAAKAAAAGERFAAVEEANALRRAAITASRD